jgi:hypothetical protein
MLYCWRAPGLLKKFFEVPSSGLCLRRCGFPFFLAHIPKSPFKMVLSISLGYFSAIV